ADRGAVSTVESTFTADWRANGGSSGAPPTPTSAPSGKLRVRVTVSPPSARVGESMTVSASTAAGATCRVRVTYPDGYVSRARALSETKTAGAGGEVAWSWHVGSKVRGTGRAAVSCELGGASATGSASFEIR
ncbi:MAG: hypothetical protein JOZ41_16860, partial [Chloroflexi bacterium]|nr:hypothetical protein [Chloroflexota bacterium]